MVWIARAVWLALPLTHGPALDAALGARSAPVATTAAVACWFAWGAGLVALLAPRPWGFTVVRVVAGTAGAVPLLALLDAGGGPAALAIVAGLVAVPLACSAAVATAAANGVSFGDERRFPLRAPFAALVGPIPVVALAVGAGLVVGPLALAAGARALGVVGLVGGLAVAALGFRALHGLDRRWLVVVPAGFVVADPVALAEPVLVPTGRVRATAPAPAAAVPGALDLRVGTAPGAVAVRFDAPVTFTRRAARRRAEVVEADVVLVTPLRPAAFVAELRRRGARRRGARRDHH